MAASFETATSRVLGVSDKAAKNGDVNDKSELSDAGQAEAKRRKLLAHATSDGSDDDWACLSSGLEEIKAPPWMPPPKKRW